MGSLRRDSSDRAPDSHDGSGLRPLSGAGLFPIDEDFELFYRPVSEGYGEEVQLDEGEAEMGFYEGDGLELNDVLREFVLLALPMQRVCSEDCKGICPECGQNRNQKECACQAAAVNDRWAALKKLREVGRA